MVEIKKHWYQVLTRPWQLTFGVAIALGIAIGISQWRSSKDNDQSHHLINWPQTSAFDLLKDEPQNFDFKTVKEPYIILHFWASWCPPCRDEFPSLIAAAPLIPSYVKLIVVSEDDTSLAGRHFFQMFEGHDKLLALWDPQKNLSTQFGTSKLPETYILGPDRQILRKIGGSMDWMKEKNLNFFKSLPLQP